MYYKIILECGHVGAGKSVDRTWFINSVDPQDVINKVKRLPQLKKKSSTRAIKLIKEISEDEFIRGVVQNKYLRVPPLKNRAGARMNPLGERPDNNS